MDVNRLGTGEKIAAVSGIALILIMFIFKWFGLKLSGGVGGFGVSVEGSRNAWGSYGFTDIVLFVTALAAIGLALIKGTETRVETPVALSAIVTGLGVISLILVIISIISPPDFGVDISGAGIDHTRKIGAWLGLIATAVLTYGGWRAMQEEGTSFSAQRDRLTGGGAGPGPGAPPPPPSSE